MQTVPEPKEEYFAQLTAMEKEKYKDYENPEKYILHQSLSKSIASENMKHYFDRLFTIEKEKKKRGSWVNEDRLSW